MRKKRILFCSEATFLNTGYSTYTREILNYLHGTGKYELAELASYGEFRDPRAANIPWKYYGVVPDGSATPEQHKAYGSKGTNQFGEWIFEHVCLDFFPDVVCVPPKTLVATQNGYKQIHSIKVGDKVLSHAGKYQKVLKTMRREHLGEVVKIKVNGDSQYMSLTPEHPVLVYKKRKQTNQKKSIKLIYDGVQPEFVPAKDVSVGDLAVFPQAKSSEIAVSVDVAYYLENYITDKGDSAKICPTKTTNTNPINRRISINHDFGTLCGYIIGDAGISDSGITITFQGNEMEFALDCQRLFSSVFGVTSQVNEASDKYAITVTANSVLLGEFFSKFLGGLTREKFIPWQIRSGSIHSKRGMVRGLIRADGCYKSNTVSFTSVNKALAYEVRQLCIDIGIPVNISLNSSNGGYNVEGYGESAVALHNIVEKQDKHVDSFFPQGTRSPRSTHIVNGHMVATINRVRTEPYNGQVYNLEVEHDNSYTLNWCVHNCDIRDFWMLDFQERSPFRPFYKWAIMPTVDAAPQHRQWIATYQNADAVFTYSDWAGGVLNEQSKGKINYLGSAPPSAHPAYNPVEDKRAHKARFGIDPEYKIIGTVMRNQRRKLYPDLFEAFKLFLDNSPNKKFYLYCHTSYPDLGWDIPELLQTHGLASHVLFTYKCPETKKIFPSLFRGCVTQSPFTGKWGSTLCNVKNGAEYSELSDIINLFDLYVQYANCEGFGLPQVEAAACGVPVMATDYSAMTSVVRQLEGFPITPKGFYKELETGCMRAVPDNELAASMFNGFFQMPEETRKSIGEQTRKNFEKHFQWHISGGMWESYFDSVEILPFEQTWGSPPRIRQAEPYPQNPPQAPHNDLARWLIAKVYCEPEKLNTFMEARLTRDLMYKTATASTGGMYFNEMGAAFDGANNIQEFTFEMAYNQFRGMCENRNAWERLRAQKVQSLQQK